MAQVSYSWLIKIFDLNGTEICTIEKAVDQTMVFVLNGIDTCSFGVYLDNENAVELQTLRRVVKVWRTVVDVDNSIDYSDPDETPCFAGIITRIEKDGETNLLSLLAQAPMWRLKGRFHRNNWKLVIDYAGQHLSHGWDGGNEDGEKWDVSAICWRLIDLVNHQLGATDAALTGIIKPVGDFPGPFWEKTLTLHGGRNVRRGTWVYDEIEELMGQQDVDITSPDKIPEYINDGTYALQYFKTAPYRGSDVSATVKFEYCTGLSNLQNFNEIEEIVPGKDANFANYVWAVGNGNFETARKVSQDLSGNDYSIEEVSNYMFIVESDSDDVKSNGILQNQADYNLKKLHVRPVVYAITPMPLKPPYWGAQFGLGDIVLLNADKGALVVTNLKQRVYEATLSLSAGCVETYSLSIATDFYNKVPPA